MLSKCQHGVSKVNQIPWHYHDRIDHLKDDLNKVITTEYGGPNKDAKIKLKSGEFVTGTLIVTEARRSTRSSNVDGCDIDQAAIDSARNVAVKFVDTLKSEIDRRICEDRVTKLMKKTFSGNFEETALTELLDIAKSSGRNYGNIDDLISQQKVLKNRYNGTNAKDEMSKWLMLCTKPRLYKDIPDILHLALSCFVKAPIETPAESVGSLINQHGRKQRCGLSATSLSSEVQIAWNGSAEFDPVTDKLIDESIDEYFLEHSKTGNPRFYVTTKLHLASSTISSHLQKKSRINF